MQVNIHQRLFPGDSGDAYIENKKTAPSTAFATPTRRWPATTSGSPEAARAGAARPHPRERRAGRRRPPAGRRGHGTDPPLQKIGKGIFALQCHDGKSQVQYRRIAVHPLPPSRPARLHARQPDPASAKRDRLRATISAGRSARASTPRTPARSRPRWLRLARCAMSGSARQPANCDAQERRRRRCLVKRFGGTPLFLGSRATSAAGPRPSCRRRWPGSIRAARGRDAAGRLAEAD